MEFKATVEYRGPITALMKKRIWNQQVEEPSWLEPLRLWVEKFRPIHFTHAGFRRYGYSPRSGQDAPRDSRLFWTSYFGRKLRKAKHSLPLVYSGELEQMTALGVYRLNSKRGKYVMPGAQKANFRQPGSKVNMRDELTKLTDTEMRAMVREKKRALIKRLLAVRNRILSTPSWSR